MLLPTQVVHVQAVVRVVDSARCLHRRLLRMALTRSVVLHRLGTHWASLLQAVATRARSARCLRRRALQMARTRAVVLHRLVTRWASSLRETVMPMD